MKIVEWMSVKGRVALTAEGANQRLPQELGEFLARDTYSLLIKGGSGTGKTILALTILKALQPIENPLYLSTRTSPLQLVEDHPWVEDIFGPATEAGTGEDSEGWQTLVDARLDEPNVVFERITNVLMDKHAPTVVIDSWESLGDSLGTDALRTNIRVLETWRERAGARFIFVGEDPGNSTIDFMVEGVVVLKEREVEGRRLREVVLSKLHGVQIPKPSYFFTLDGGTFTSIPPYSPREYSFRDPLPVTLDKPFRRLKARYPTGYPSLDSQLDGGYPAKSVAVVETGPHVDFKAGLVFVSRSVQDWLAAGDCVILDTPQEVEQHYLTQYAKSFATRAGDRFQILGGAGKRKGIGGAQTQAKTRNRRPKTLSVISGAEETPVATGRVASGRPKSRMSDLTIVIGRSGQLSKEILEHASVHLRIMEVEGTLFVASELPRSGFHGIVPGMIGGNPTIQLEPVV